MLLREIANQYSNDRQFVEQNFYIFDENYNYIVIEESKEKYTIYFDKNDQAIEVTPDYDTGSTDQRAKQILNDIKNRTDFGFSNNDDF